MEYDIWYKRLYKNNSKVSFPGVLLNGHSVCPLNQQTHDLIYI